MLTDAGKPVYIRYLQSLPILSHSLQPHRISRPEGGDQDGIASTIGIMQALISVFLDDNDKLRCINAGRTRITFLLRPPLYYVCVSSWGEPESVVCAPSILSVSVMTPDHGSCEGRQERISSICTYKFLASSAERNLNKYSKDELILT